MTEAVEKKLREFYGRYVQKCFIEARRPVSWVKFEEAFEARMHRYVATDLARAVMEQQSDKGLYIAPPATDIPEEVMDKYKLKVKYCKNCGKGVAIDPNMVKFAKKAKAITCSRCLPEVVGVTMEEICNQVLKIYGADIENS